MNAIAPHNPPIQGSPGQLPTGGGGGKKDDGTSFDDLLSGAPTKGVPSPIDDHAPPPGIDDVPPDDLTGPPLPRPIRWKGTKGTAADSPDSDPGATVPPLPPQPDLRAIVPIVTLSGGWTRPIVTPESAEGPTTDVGSANQDAATKISAASSRENRSSPGVYPVMSSRLTPMPISVLAGVTADLTDQLPMFAAQETTGTLPTAISDPMSEGESVGLQTTGADAAPVGPAKEDRPILPAPTMAQSDRIPDFDTDLTFIKVPPPGAVTLPPNPATRPPAEDAPVTAPHPVRGAESADVVVPPDRTLASSAAPAPGPQVELSAPPKADEAKIAATTKTDTPQTRTARAVPVQVPDAKPLNPTEVAAGTPVAKYANIVTATLSSNEKETAPGPFSKRAGGVSAGAGSSGRAGVSGTPGREVPAGIAVSGATELSAIAPQVTATPTPEPTAARQVVRVETLLQNALSTGENLRPNGHDHTELRVRLGGGSEDVTVRLQVVNDRMQVTFQTNSPEMRKALEHGWEQFSTTAAHASTLSLSTPRFESGPASAVPQQGRETDAQGFSSDQQNSRRQETAEAGYEEEVFAPGSRRDVSPAATASSATARRWSGWA